MTAPLTKPNTGGNGTIEADLHPSSAAEIVMPKLIAFYLPQFHPTPENDLWWGKGFTEWTNVTKAQPLFRGHLQPHLPTDFGFYDLRARETLHDQIEVAKKYGIDGFCYHYYWFSGRRLLDRPVDDMLRDPAANMPFCLCWANENWTRRWDAAEQEILIAQKYLPDDDRDFIDSLLPFFSDPRYIRIDGKPFLIVYRPQHLPDAKQAAQNWRERCRVMGIGEIHLCAALTHGNTDFTKFGFDSGVEFPPHNLRSANINHELDFYSPFIGNVIDYETIAQSYLERQYECGPIFKSVFPSWDNTARTKERALVVLNGTPNNYEFWLSSTIDLVRQNSRGSALLFVNAWNEWAEGCHLEPDRRFGRGFLEATLSAKNGIRRFPSFPDVGIPDNGPSTAVLAGSEGPLGELASQRRTLWSDLAEIAKFHATRVLCAIKSAVKRRRWLWRMLLPIVGFMRSLRAKVQ